MNALGRSLLRVVAAITAYVLAAWVAGALTLPHDVAASLRPPNALMVALALLDAPEHWWIYALATVPGNRSFFVGNVPIVFSVGYAIANSLEVAVAALMLRARLGPAPRLNSLRASGVFIGATFVACAASALVGAAVVRFQTGDQFVQTWRTWCLGDALSFIVIVPVVVLAARETWTNRRGSRGEIAFLALALVSVTVLAMSGRFGQVARFPGLVYAPLPFLVWAAARLGALENALAVLAVSGVVLGTAITQQGAFAGLTSDDAALSMQLLLIMIAVPLMFLAATVEERRRSTDLFSKAFHSSPNAMAITTLDDGRFIEVNDRFEQMTGFTRAQVTGKTGVELNLFASPEARSAFAEKVRRHGSLRDEPLQVRRRDGEILDIVMSTERVDIDGVEALMNTARDVTDDRRAEAERARVEDQLQQTRRLEAIGQLAGGIAHDFNNVLQAVKGYIELAADSLPPDHPVLAQLSQMNHATDRAATFTAQLLTFSRRDAPRSETLDLNQVVGDTGVLLRRALGGHIQVAIVEGGGLSPIEGARGQIEQIIMNLAINARDAMPNGGKVTIETGRTQFTAADLRARPWAREGRWVFLRVRDEGTGIPEHVLPHIFEPFFTTKPVGQATGLGLSTVYAIVERHGGLTSVDTQVGVGSAITVYFPSLSADVPAPIATRAQLGALTGSGETILLAEDEPFVRDLAVEMLQGANYRVIVACDGAEAETIIRDRAADFQMAVLDVVMPFRSGRQVYDTLQTERPDVPVVFCSGYSFGELSDVAKLAGTSVLSKPYSRASLLATVRSALDAQGPSQAD